MRIISHLILCTIFLSSTIGAWAVPHALDDYYNEQKLFAIDVLAEKRPLTYKIEDPDNPANDYNIPGDYQKWFNNVLIRLKEKQRSELSGILDILEFGATNAAYAVDTQNPLITFHFRKTGKEIYSSCGRGAAACFKFHLNKMQIYALAPNSETAYYYSDLIHEIGHSLRMEDLYDNQLPSTAGKYGSGVKPSIMLYNKELSCDDADALVNAIYLTKKLANPAFPDLVFTSFCDQNITFKNARQQNRKPMVIDDEGKRTIYTYCKSGEIKEIRQINPVNYDNLIKTLQEPSECQMAQAPSYALNVDENESYYIADFKTGDILSSKKVQSSQVPDGKNIYIAIPDSAGLQIEVKTDGRKIPGYVKIKDSKGRLVYLLAYLKEGYNLVYDAYLSGDVLPSAEASLFIYERNNKSNYYVYRNPPWPEIQCKASEQECKKMSNILENYAHDLSKEGLKYPPFGGFYNGNHKNNIDNASSWENFLLKNYPPLNVFIEKAKTDLKFDVQTQKKIKLPL